MSYRLRAATPDDLEPLYEMAKLTGGGFTNLPPDRKALARKLERAEAAYARDENRLADEQFVAVEVILEAAVERQIVPRLQKAGASGIIVYPLNKVIP